MMCARCVSTVRTEMKSLLPEADPRIRAVAIEALLEMPEARG
jgi:hypothetical protein